MSGPRTVVVVVGGDPPVTSVARGLPGDATVIAADSGLEHALGLGLEVDLVVGDMDSVDADVLAEAASAGVEVERHPVAKDQTDLDLAMDRAMAYEPARLVVIGGSGGRLDQLLAVVSSLASPAYASVPIEARLGPAAISVVRDQVTVTGRPGELVTLLPVHGSARSVTTGGLRYPLDDEDLEAGTSRGVSNELVGTTGEVRLLEGVLWVIQPEAYGHP